MSPRSERESTWNARPIPDRVKGRAFHKWTPAGECRISSYKTRRNGYAQVGWSTGGRSFMVSAHRAAWEYVYGPTPVGQTFDHTCKTRDCVNPDHLRFLDNFENARRTKGRDWPLGFCINGHPNSELVTRPSGVTECAVCRREWNARTRARRRAKKAADRLG